MLQLKESDRASSRLCSWRIPEVHLSQTANEKYRQLNAEYTALRALHEAAMVLLTWASILTKISHSVLCYISYLCSLSLYLSLFLSPSPSLSFWGSFSPSLHSSAFLCLSLSLSLSLSLYLSLSTVFPTRVAGHAFLGPRKQLRRSPCPVHADWLIGAFLPSDVHVHPMSSSLVNGQSGLVTHPCPPQVTADLNTVSAAEVEFTFAYQAAQQAQVHPAEIPVLLTDGGVGQAALPVDPGDIVTSPADEALGGGAQPDKELEPGDMGLGDTEPANAASATATAAPDPTDTASASTSEEAFPRKNLDTSANQNLDPDAESFAPGAPAERPPAAAADNVTAPRAGAEREPSHPPTNHHHHPSPTTHPPTTIHPPTTTCHPPTERVDGAALHRGLQQRVGQVRPLTTCMNPAASIGSQAPISTRGAVPSRAKRTRRVHAWS